MEWALDGPLPKLCPVISASNYDGRQAKNRKRGDDILIVHCCFSVSQNELLLKIEISSNGQNCSILSQNVPKFELYKHNDELFSMYDRIFYELWTFADFDLVCKLEKRGYEI